MQTRNQRAARNRIVSYYPDAGPLRRELYPKHLEFFTAGNTHRERLMLAANRVGKTEGVGGYEIALHLTGRYPAWWTGRRYDRGVRAWACGDTGKTVRDIVQAKLFGDQGSLGTGLIPADTIIGDPAPKSGVPGAIDYAHITHVSGQRSSIYLKSYDQGRISFQGTEQDLIWLDEEPPEDIYTECLMRTMTTDGLLILTFTPLMGMTPLVQSFVQPEGPAL